MSYRTPPEARLEFAGVGSPLLAFSHATGFCKEVWKPSVAAVRAAEIRLPAVAWDYRCHGDAPVVEGEFDWWMFAEDALSVVAGRGPVLGIGHSMGGAALVLAELAAPGTFAGLLLIEPIIVPGPTVRWDNGPMAEGARRRRAVFPSRADALDNYRGKGGFATWTEESLEAYVDGGFRVQDDGSLTLKCRPDREAEVFAASLTHGAFDRLGELTCPVRIIAGEVTDTHPHAILEQYLSVIPDSTVAMLPGTTHFIPMERPDLVAGEIAGLLSRL